MSQEDQPLFPLENYKKKKYSYSQLKVYLQCKLRYKLKYIDKRLNQDQRTTYYLSLGRSIHKFFELFAQTNNYPVFNDDDIFSLLEKCWISDGYKNKEQEQKWFENSQRMIKEFLKKENLSNDTLFVEHSFNKELENFEITSKIDRIDKINTKECELVDYKVGKNEISIDELKDDLQWIFHYYSSKDELIKFYKVEPKKVIFVFLDVGLTEVIIPNEKDVNFALGRIINLVNEIEMQKDFSPKLNRYCVDCRFDLICPLIKDLKNRSIDIDLYLKEL